MRTRIKICGITRWEDAQSCIDNGVDALGLVFVPASPRCVDVKRAASIASRLPPFMMSVGLFMNQSEQAVKTVLNDVVLDLLQFHGDEDAEYCNSFGKPYIKAIPMGDNVDPGEYMASHPQAKGFLLDSHGQGSSGGSGHTFDWTRMPRSVGIPLIVAGGLDPQNVSGAIEQLKPYAVDVSSGVEESKGIKNLDKIKAFVNAVRTGDKVYEVD